LPFGQQSQSVPAQVNIPAIARKGRATNERSLA
jgi:hypothetical protein